MRNTKNEGPKRFDVSDTPDASGRQSASAPGARNAPPSMPPRGTVRTPATRPPKAGPSRPLPGMMQGEAGTPFNPMGKSTTQPSQTQQGQERSARSRSPTQPLNPVPSGQSAAWNVTIGTDTYHVPHHDAEAAKNAVIDMWKKENPGMNVNPGAVRVEPADQQQQQAGPKTEMGAGGLAGFQGPLGDDVREAIRAMVREVVRKKAGGGGYNLYSPNRGKKKDPKPVGEFPSRLQAKEAELQRFPPRDPEQLKRARKRLDKLRKDPKKRNEKETGELGGKRGPKMKKSKKAAKEALMRVMVRQIRERLFREDEVPGSPWDERIGSLNPDAVASDKKLHGLHRGIEGASIGALGDGHKAMARALRGVAKVHPGEHAFDPERKKMYLPCHLDVEGTEVGPVHLYVDGGHVKIEVSQDARQQIAGLEPGTAKSLRGGLMSLEEDHLPKIDRARKAWGERDAYLDKVHGKLEKSIGGMSGVEAHLAKALLAKHGRGKK